MREKKTEICRWGKRYSKMISSFFLKQNFYMKALIPSLIVLLFWDAVSGDEKIRCLPDNQSKPFISPEYKEHLPKGKFKTVKIPGLKKQIKETLASGKQPWKGIGPGLVNVPMKIYINGNRILVMTDWGLNESLDGGKSWRTISYTSFGGLSNTNTYSFAVSPRNPNLIVVGSKQLYRTSDNGKSWREICRGVPEPSMLGATRPSFSQLTFNSDGSRVFVASSLNLEFSSIKKRGRWSVPVFPSKVIFIGDAGAESFKMIDLKRPFASIRCIYAMPSNPDIVIFSYQDGDLFITRNARASQPVFQLVKVPEGFFVRNMVSLFSRVDEMLATLVPSANAGFMNRTNVGPLRKSKLFKIKNIMGDTISFEEMPIVDAEGKALADSLIWPVKGGFVDLPSIAINPENPEQIVIGTFGTGKGLISDDSGKTFRWLCSDKKQGGNNETKPSFSFFWFGHSPFAVVSSRTGAWITRDGFKTFTPLFMTSDPTDKWHGNRGVAAVANTRGIAVTKDNVYLGVFDHRIWRSNGKDLSLWEDAVLHTKTLAEGFNFIPLYEFFASPDGKHIYTIAKKSYAEREKPRLFKYEEKSDDWIDITNLLGIDVNFTSRNPVESFAFNSQNNNEHWFALNIDKTKKLFRSTDEGKKFQAFGVELGKKLRANSNYINFGGLCYDPSKNILYMGINAKKRYTQEKSLKSLGIHPLYRSFDKGSTFEPFDVGVNNVTGIAVAANGNLIVGTCLDYELPGQLITLIDSDPAKREVKCTIGDTLEEACMGQELFTNIQSDGNDVLAIADCRWGATRLAPMGPLLSRDGGKTFSWIRYNLPCTGGAPATISNGIIIMEDPANLSVYKYKDSDFKLPGTPKDKKNEE